MRLSLYMMMVCCSREVFLLHPLFWDYCFNIVSNTVAPCVYCIKGITVTDVVVLLLKFDTVLV